MVIQSSIPPPPTRLRGCSHPPSPRFSPSTHTRSATHAFRRAAFRLIHAKDSARLRARGGTGVRSGENRGEGGWEQPGNYTQHMKAPTELSIATELDAIINDR